MAVIMFICAAHIPSNEAEIPTIDVSQRLIRMEYRSKSTRNCATQRQISSKFRSMVNANPLFAHFDKDTKDEVWIVLNNTDSAFPLSPTALQAYKKFGNLVFLEKGGSGGAIMDGTLDETPSAKFIDKRSDFKGIEGSVIPFMLMFVIPTICLGLVWLYGVQRARTGQT